MRHEELVLYRKYNPGEYPKYDSYDAIEVGKTADMPAVMYWAVREDGTYEVIDGQQRTLSICEYVAGRFAYMFRYFGNLTVDEQNAILDYGLTVYFCEGTESEKLEWFRTINIAGEELTEQELLNAVYAGPWTADLKRYFSRSVVPAFGLGSRYMNGEPIRQDYLATVLKWNPAGTGPVLPLKSMLF